MRAMILAAGRGTRMGALSDLRPKPALPVRGVPLVAHLLAWLRGAGVTEVLLNLHHRADVMQATAERWCPPDVELCFSREEELLGTGGGIAKAAPFLRECDPCLVVAGDMLCDTDLRSFVRAHRERGDAATLLLRTDPRTARFGSIGIDGEGTVRRIGASFDLGGETASGLFVGVRALAARAFDTLDDRAARGGAFEDLRDWLAPLVERGARDVRGLVRSERDLVWEPVGTPSEYLAANLAPPSLAWAGAPWPLAAGTRVEGDVVIGAGAVVPTDARLARAVVWDGERVPAGFSGRDGVFAGGRFHSATPLASERASARPAS